MSKPTVYALAAVLAAVTIIVGCATQSPTIRHSSMQEQTLKAEQESRQRQMALIKQRGGNVQGLINPAGPRNTDDSVLLPPGQGENLIIEKPKAQNYGPTRFDQAPQTPSSTLRVRGSRIELHNQKPLAPPTEEGRALFHDAKKLPQQQKENPAAEEHLVAAKDLGSGALLARLPDQKQVPIPLKHTAVHADILGYISTVDVTQQYANPYNEKIEAVYVFPLPQDAAVSDFVMTIGDRKIRGIVREKEEAQRIYNAAKSRGYVASLMTQDRPNIFTQSVANIEPGKQIDVNIRYFNALQYVDGWYEFTFPMVVGSRFNPPGYTEGIGAKAHGSAAGITGQSKEIEYLKPDERTGHDISLSVNIDAGVTIEKLESVNHRIAQTSSEGITKVELASDDTIPNKDFVLRFKVAGDHLKSALITQRDERGGFFTLILYPPDSLKDIPRSPLEMVFTLDVSGSMSGRPIEQSRAAIRYALTHMRPDDTFQIIRFASNTEMMSPTAIPATSENLERALRQINPMDAGGGTRMLEGIRQALNFQRDQSRLRYITFLTDGYIGNEREILAEIRKSRAGARIFSFGVGSSPNRYLLDGMARIGAGTVAYLSLNDDANKVMADYFERIAHPALGDISVDFGEMKATDVFPQKIPDLFVGRPVIITGRFTGEAPKTIKVRGKIGGGPQEFVVKSDAIETGTRNALPAVWARAKITDLSDAAVDLSQNPSANDTAMQIKNVALEFDLMSDYTSFVAVDSSQITAGDHGTTVNVPVPAPDGVRYDTTVMEGTKQVKHVE